MSPPVKQHFHFQTQRSDAVEKPGGEKDERHPINAVMQMFSHLRAVEDLEPLPLPEAEVILGPGFVVVQSHKQSHPCRKSKSDMWRSEPEEVSCTDALVRPDSHRGFIVCITHLGIGTTALY